MRKPPDLDVDLYPPFSGFPKSGIDFFKRLKRNNDRKWFEEHKGEYENLVKAPMQSLIMSLQPRIAQFAPEFDLNPKRAIFRIYRDIRFSSDKTPYKTYSAAHFVLRGQPKGFIGSGYYIQVGPGEAYTGGGIYIPDGDQLKKIRKAIAARGEEFLEIVNAPRFKKRFSPFNWQQLKCMPKSYDEIHPMAEWLKYKQFFVGVSWPESKCYRGKFVDEVAKICEEVTPLVRFLNSSFQ
jgi:uncharacterized protein (TIGR02453 family)